MKPGPVLLVHGGAGCLPHQADRDQYLEGVAAALRAGQAALPRSAREAVRAAVMHLESHTITNSGRGATLAQDGSVALDAGFMCGRTRRYGGVTGVRCTENPIVLAEFLCDDGDFGRLLGPPSADALVPLAGARPCRQDELITERARRLHAERKAALQARRDPDEARWLDTVGAVALDGHGHLAAAVSTGGMSMKRPGRIGDSPVVGGGFWADDRLGAAVTTGVGEVLLRQGTARYAVRLLGQGLDPAAAAARALDDLLDTPDDRRGRSGIILLSRDGRLCLDHNAEEMSAGWIRPDGASEVTHLWRNPA